MRASFLTCLFVACTAGCALFGCVDDDYTFNGTDDLDSSTGDSNSDAVSETPPPDTGCKNDGDCTGRLDAPLCNVTTGACVECLDDSRCGPHDGLVDTMGRFSLHRHGQLLLIHMRPQVVPLPHQVARKVQVVSVHDSSEDHMSAVRVV